MKQILLDTHAWVWSLTDDPRLSPAARKACETAESVFISAISLFEIGQKVRLGKWPEMEPFAHDLIAIAERQGARLMPVSANASLLAALLDWTHRDPFDRMIAATAIAGGLPLVSADAIFDDLNGRENWRARLW